MNLFYIIFGNICILTLIIIFYAKAVRDHIQQEQEKEEKRKVQFYSRIITEEK
jgi:uncharacterized membrane protein